MTSNKNCIIFVLMGLAALVLGGCGSAPYEPWQAGESWYDNEEVSQMSADKPAAGPAEEKPAYTPAQPEYSTDRPTATSLTQPVEIEPEPEPMATSESVSPQTPDIDAPRSTTGDVLLIERVRSQPKIATPRSGQTMDDIRSQFGEPISRGASIGDPPITRWQYPDFSVYFEHNLVLHAVVHRPKK